MRDGRTGRHVVIMAGGKGTRFWPESTAIMPKQLLDLLGTGKSLLRTSYERALGLVPPSNVWVVTSAIIEDRVRQDLPGLAPENLLVEPVGRNTAPCVGWAALRVMAVDPCAVMAVLPADHHIRDEAGFSAAVGEALDRACDEGTIVTLGIRPTRPETGYGYIQAGEALSGNVRVALRFVEKPDRPTAERYVADGNYVWNAGIFCFTAHRILADIARFMPALREGLDDIDEAIRTGGPSAEKIVVARVYSSLVGDSIDYGIMEKKESGSIEVIPVDVGWSDLGSWSAIHERLEHDALGNSVRGGARPVMLDVSGCLLSTTRPDKIVALCGVDDLVVIDTEDVLLICPRDRDQDVKRLVEIASEDQEIGR